MHQYSSTNLHKIHNSAANWNGKCVCWSLMISHKFAADQMKWFESAKMTFKRRKYSHVPADCKKINKFLALIRMWPQYAVDFCWRNTCKRNETSVWCWQQHSSLAYLFIHLAVAVHRYCLRLGGIGMASKCAFENSFDASTSHLLFIVWSLSPSFGIGAICVWFE